MKLPGTETGKFWVFLAVYLVFLAILGLYKPSNTCLWINRQCYVLELSRSPQELERGLSGRDNMPINHGMLFVFGRPDIYCFWMKDMKFDLDMVWVDSNKQIIKILPGVKSISYPESYCPSTPAKYVIELSSGQTEKLGLEIGQKLDF